MNKLEFINQVFEQEKIFERTDLSVQPQLLLQVLSKKTYSLKEDLNITHYKVAQLIETLWPERVKSNQKVCSYLLEKYNYSFCSNCEKVLELGMFSKNASRGRMVNSHCKACYTETTRSYQREYQKRRKLLEISRVPSWANLEKIQEIYKNCPEGYHVDHIIPLQGKTVCGLHVESNLQYLSATENLSKHNKFNDWDVN